MSNSLPEIEESTLLFDQYFKVRRDTLKREGKKPYPYYILEIAPQSVMVIALTLDEKVLVTHEYRHPTQKFLLSGPGGLLETDEEPIEGAKRELLEETGYRADSYEVLASAYPFPGICGQRVHYVLATGAKKVQEPQLEGGEILTASTLSVAEVKAKMQAADNLDGIFCSAFLLYLQKGRA